MIDFRLRVRSAAAAVALVLSWFAIATILAEGLTAKQRSFSPGATPEWAVGIAPLRGDLLADVAGYVASGKAATAGSFTSLAPTSLLDTRLGNGAPRGVRGPRSGARPGGPGTPGAVTSSSTPGAAATGTLASDEALAALREKLTGN